MALGIEGIIWYLFLLDSFGAVIAALFFAKWYKKTFKGIWKHLPATKAWAFIYFILVLWVGSTLYGMGMLGF